MAKTKATKKTTTKKTTAAKPKTKKPATRASARAPQPAVAQRVAKMTGGLVVGGNINAGRDVVMGDQRNRTDNRRLQVNSPAELAAELKQVQAQLAALRVKHTAQLEDDDRQLIEVVEGQVAKAAAEAEQPKPDGDRIGTTLEKAQKRLETMTAGVGAAVGLGTAIGALAPHLETLSHLAKQLFK